jgi:hypothetical protein
LGTLALTENLAEQIRKNPTLEITGPPFALEFDAEGNFGRFPGYESARYAL